LYKDENLQLEGFCKLNKNYRINMDFAPY